MAAVGPWREVARSAQSPLLLLLLWLLLSLATGMRHVRTVRPPDSPKRSFPSQASPSRSLKLGVEKLRPPPWIRVDHTDWRLQKARARTFLPEHVFATGPKEGTGPSRPQRAVGQNRWTDRLTTQ